MGKFKSGNRERPRGRDRGFGGNRSGGRDRGRDSGRSRWFGRGRAELHDAVCDQCGKPCKLPFKPTEGKPVLCSDCFKQKNPDRGRGQGRGFGGRGQGGSGMSEKLLGQINEKLDRIISALEKK